MKPGNQHIKICSGAKSCSVKLRNKYKFAKKLKFILKLLLLFVSTSMRMSTGTVAALVYIARGISDKTSIIFTKYEIVH